MVKKLVLGPDFELEPKFEPPKIWLRQSLDIVVRYHAQHQKKLMIQF